MLHIGIYSGKGGALLGDYSARAVGVKFGSNKHGFATCSFFIPAALAESFMLYDRPSTPWVYVTENGLSIWEGRIEDPAIENAGVGVTAFGAWRYLSDISYTATYTSTDAQAIAQALVAAVAAVNSAFSSNTALIQNPGLTLTEQYVDKRPAEILDRLCLLGDSQTPPRVWEACVWEDATLSFRPRASAGRTWYVDVSAIKLNRTLDSLINRVTAGYQGPANVPLETSTVNDTSSQGRYELVRAAKINVQTTDATLAAIIRDLFLADNADPKPATSISFDRVYDATGTPYPLYLVRAGDTLVVNNLPLTLSATVDRIRSFVIAEAVYDVDQRQLNVVLETPTPALDIFGARLSGNQIGNIVGGGETAVPPVPDGRTPSYVEIDPATNGASIAGGLNVGSVTGAATGEIRTQNLVSVSPGAGYADNLYYAGGWKYMANGYGFYIKESANGVEIYTAPNNVSGAGAAATLTLRGIIGPTGYIYTGSGQFDTGLIIQASSHATSERAAILLGSEWLIGQDAAGDGTKNFFLYHGSTTKSPIQITVGDSVAIGKASLATNATTGFVYIPSCAGVPTGTPETVTGMVPLVFDTTNFRLYAYRGGAWAFVAI